MVMKRDERTWQLGGLVMVMKRDERTWQLGVLGMVMKWDERTWQLGKSRGLLDFLGGGRLWVVILSLIIMYFASHWNIVYNPHYSEQSTMINKVASSLFGLVVLSALSVTDHGVMGCELIAERLRQQNAQTRNVSQ
jgi:hypothetical protein